MRLPPLTFPAVIATDRLVLRRYSEEDAPAYLDVCLLNRDHLFPFEAGNPARQVASLEAALALLRRYDDDWAGGRAHFLGAWSRAAGLFVAQIYVGVAQSAPLPLELEVGYFVDREHEGQGYVSEAVRGVLDAAFGSLGVHAVRLECSELNVRSVRVAERTGFRRVGYRHRAHPDLPQADGEPSGDLLYELTASEWRSGRTLQKT